MWLLTVSIIVFIIVIALIVYSNWPATASGKSCGSDPCPPPPCNACGVPKPRCRCPPAGSCQFC